MTYQEQIKHPKWQKKRLEVLKLNKFACKECGTKDEELHVHHPFYRRGAMIWEYKKEELQCLCHKCHKNAHDVDEQIKKALACCLDKKKVLEFIVTLNQGEAKPKEKSKDSRIVATLERVAVENEAAEIEAAERDALFCKEYPHLAPHPDDTDDDRAYKFFAKMRIIMG